MKKFFAILISTLLALTIFTGCKANKAESTITPDPPTGTTKNEVVPEREKIEEVKTTLPENTSKKDVVTEKTETKSQQKPAGTTENRTKPVFKITKDEAKTIALGHAGLAETDVRFYKTELDRERKIIVYEIDFDSGKYEYEYEIDADTGKVIKAQKEIRD